MNEQKNNGRGIFYGVIGVATLVVAIIGATFAYFTATQSNNSITGNMATIKLNLAVDKKTNAEEASGGLIPMSNGMVERAVNVAGITGKEICKDDNGNGVCQVYKITLTNASSAGQFVDGYVALKDKFAIPAADIDGLMEPSTTEGASDTPYKYKDGGADTDYPKPVLMRWAQVFCDDAVTSCTTAGEQKLGADTNPTFTAIGEAQNTTGAKAGHNQSNIRYLFKDSTDARGVLGKATISGNEYDVINKNYIRLSDHVWTEGVQSYDRASDVTSALVFNHNVAANAEVSYYIVVWLSETGTNQTAGATVGEDGSTTNPAADSFFMGNVTFVSAQGSEVSATFSGYTKVKSDNATGA